MARGLVGVVSGMLALLGLSAGAPVALGQASVETQVTRTSATTQESSAETNELAGDMELARGLSRVFKRVAKRVEPAVVHISQFNRVTRRDIFGRPLMGNSDLTQTGLGSGVIISRDGYILTNNHVAGGAQALKVKLFDGTEHEASVVGRDQLTDLAVIKIDANAIPSTTAIPHFADSEALDVGEWVIAIGSPFGFDSTVTAGIVSAKGRSLADPQSVAYQDFIQTDAAINPGNSGGPLLNLDGEIVGINTAIAGPSRGFHGLGFAIPSNMARSIAESLIANRRVVRGGLGVTFETTNTGSGQTPGVVVGEVVPNSPASDAGLQSGDVIVKFNGKPVDIVRLRTEIAVSAPGTDAVLDVVRSGKAQQIRARIGDQDTILGIVRLDSLGVGVVDFTREQSRKVYGQTILGAVVRDVDPGSPAEAAGLQPGDIIVEILKPINARQSQSIDSSNDLRKTVEEIDGGVRLGVIRGSRQGYIDIKP
ncbi:MAG: trypsin-like peptidase domain-containing protein [Phycisphaerales bacterium]|nr:MAG: trypsin-like peptidase domain-containing protein [Phycisphaerales bacterium]